MISDELPHTHIHIHLSQAIAKFESVGHRTEMGARTDKVKLLLAELQVCEAKQRDLDKVWTPLVPLSKAKNFVTLSHFYTFFLTGSRTSSRTFGSNHEAPTPTFLPTGEDMQFLLDILVSE